jgi:hypothetical protein
VNSKKSYLNTANKVVNERGDNYDHPLINFLRIAIRWSLWLNKLVTPLDVAIMMIELKLARTQHWLLDDNLIDTAGYVETIAKMDNYVQELGFENSQTVWDGMTTIKDLVGFYEHVLARDGEKIVPKSETEKQESKQNENYPQR